jgi:hypothetical protein
MKRKTRDEMDPKDREHLERLEAGMPPEHKNLLEDAIYEAEKGLILEGHAFEALDVSAAAFTKLSREHPEECAAIQDVMVFEYIRDEFVRQAAIMYPDALPIMAKARKAAK